MNKEIKAKWVSALLSSEYEQGRGCLRSRGNKFCCLGVLCDIYVKEHKDAEWKTFNTSNSTLLNQTALLPRKVADWAEIPLDLNSNSYQDRISLKDKKTLTSFAVYNDSGRSFAEIAQIIETNEIIGHNV